MASNRAEEAIAPSEETASAGVHASVAPAAKAETKPLTARWLDLQTMTHSQRYRSAAESDGYHLYGNGQQRSLIIGRLKADAAGKYALAFRASSGRYFNWAYADYAGEGLTARAAHPEAIGFYNQTDLANILASIPADFPYYLQFVASSSAGWRFYVRELYFSVSPVKAVTVEAGSLGIERGLSTEITTFDEDGYIVGQRVRVRDPKHLFFDQVGFTNAYFGDIYKPSVFDRGSNFRKANYRQAFFNKQVNDRVGFSGEYNWLNRTNTLREAATVRVAETKVADKVSLELYQRVNQISFEGVDSAAGSGFAVAAQRSFHKLSGDFGYATVDSGYAGTYGEHRLSYATASALNGDGYGVGRRVFMHASYKVNPLVTAFGFYTHAVGPRILNLNQQGINAGLTFDFKAAINSGKRIF